MWLRLSSIITFGYIDEPLLNYLNDNTDSIRKAFSDPYHIFEITFNDFDKWTKTKDIHLSSAQKIEYKIAKKNVKNRGIPTMWEEFIRKLKFKINQYTTYV